MVVLVWVAQILLFFVCWRILHTVMTQAVKSAFGTSIIRELAVNLAVSIVLLIVVSTLHSPWWLMPIVGAAVGVLTGQVSGKASRQT